MNNRRSSFQVRKFVSDAVREEGVGAVNDGNGRGVYLVRFITNFPEPGKMLNENKKNKKEDF